MQTNFESSHIIMRKDCESIKSLFNLSSINYISYLCIILALQSNKIRFTENWFEYIFIENNEDIRFKMLVVQYHSTNIFCPEMIVTQRQMHRS